MKYTLFFWMLLIVSLWGKSSVEININDTDVETGFSADINRLFDYSSGTVYRVDSMLLYSDGSRMISVAFSGNNAFQGISGLEIGIGAKAVFADSYAALPLMAKVRYFLPIGALLPPVSLYSTFAYAPKVLSFSNATGYNEFRIEGDAELISNVHVYVGYRNIDTDYVGRDQTFNNSWYGGIKLTF